MKTAEIPFEGKYINGKALEKLYDFTENKFLSKTSPGIGVTTALLNYTDGNLIIVSPLTPMILKKAENRKQYRSQTQFFKCNELKENKWIKVSEYLYKTQKKDQNIIINTTPDSLSYLYENNEELFRRLSKFPIVIDEYDTVVVQSELRDQCGRFLELIFNKWKGTFTLTTATPNYSYLDVPKNLKISFYKVGRAERNKIQINYSNEYQDTFKFILSELEAGNKVACFTNNLNIHKREFSKLQKSLVGESLALKLEYYDVNTEEFSNGNPFSNADVVMFSGKYFIGYDIEDNISAVIISEAKNPATRIGVNLTIQALNRCRGEIKEILYVNTSLSSKLKPLEEHLTVAIKNFKRDVSYFSEKAFNYNYAWQIKDNEPITPELYCNRSKLAAQALNQINLFELHMPELLRKRFQEYNISLHEYTAPKIDLKPAKSVKFNERLLAVSSSNIEEMTVNYYKVKNTIRFKNQGSHNSNRAMERLTALLIKLINYDDLTLKLSNPQLKSNDLYNYLDRFLQVNYPLNYLSDNYKRSSESLRQMVKISKDNIIEIEEDLIRDWYLFFAAYRVKKTSFPKELNRYFLIREIPANWENLKEFQDDKKNRNNLAFRKVKKILETELGKLTEGETDKVKEIIKAGFSNPTDTEYTRYSKKSLKRNLINTLYYFINPNIKVPVHHNREYNPLTRFPKAYRRLLPFNYVLIDIISANAQFVDKLIGSTRAEKVYKNIIDKTGFDRGKAKKLFNHILNKHDIPHKDALEFYLDYCGYGQVESESLAKITSGVERGAFYKSMTSLERPIIELYQQEFNDNGIRIHDGLVLAPWDIDKPLPLSVNGIRFKASYFENDSTYEGQVIEEDIRTNFVF